MSEKRKGAAAPTPEEETSNISPFIIQEKRGDGSVARFSSLEQFAENLPDLLAALDEADAAIRAEMEKQYNLETMRAFTPEVASMPFAHDLKINEVLYRGLGHASENTLDWADKETNGGARRYLFFCMNLRYTFLSSMVELETAVEEEAAEFERLGLKLDEFEHVDLASLPVTLNCEKADGLPLGYIKGEEESYPYQGIRDPQDVFNILRALYVIGLESFLRQVVGRTPILPSQKRLLASEEKPHIDEVKSIAQFKVEKMAVNHSLLIKTLDGLVEIAYGKPSYRLDPANKKSKSQESYELTASEKRCSQFFVENNANVEHVKDIMAVIYTLRKDKRAEGFKHRGKIWFTEATIAREWLRTEQGTISNPDKAKASKKIIHDAIFMLSSAQICGTKPDGSPLAVDYVMNAVFRDKMKDEKGFIHNDVWGFPDDAIPVYSETIGSIYDYPKLDLPPLKPTNVWMRGFLIDALNQGRAKLYSGDKKTKTKNFTIKRSWETIFEKASPLKGGQLPPKTKARIVNDMQEMLRAIAKDDCKGKFRESRPMSIKAWSTRDASRGRGKGSWELLVIECSSSYRVFNEEDIDLM